MVTVAGRVTATSLLVRLTLVTLNESTVPRVTVQMSSPDPDIVALVHERESFETVAADFFPVPCSLTDAVGVIVELVVAVTSPVEAPSDCGLKCTLKLKVLPAARVTGRSPCPSTEKFWPETLS